MQIPAISRLARFVCLSTALAMPAAWASNYSDFASANDRFSVLMLHAKPETGLPQMSDPAVKDMFATVVDGNRLFAKPDAPLNKMATSLAICQQVTGYAQYYQNFGMNQFGALSGTELQQARRKQFDENLAKYGNEMSALFAFVVHCNTHLIGLMDAQRQAEPAEAATLEGKQRLHDFSVNTARAYAGLVQFVAMPFWTVPQKKVMIEASAQHAAVNAALMKPQQRQALLASLAGVDGELDPSLAVPLATVREALAGTACTGLCEY